MPETNETPISAQAYDEVAGLDSQVENVTIAIPTRRTRVDIAAGPGIIIPVNGEEEIEVWAAENQNVGNGNSYPADPNDARFRFNVGVAIAGFKTFLGSIKEFTIHAAIRAAGGGSGDIIIEYMTGGAGAWVEIDRLPLAIEQMIVKRYIMTAERYRVYFFASADTTGFDGAVYLKPQT